MKITIHLAIAVTGYLGLNNAVLLAQPNEVLSTDVSPYLPTIT
jgi:UDP-glucose 6-dehydrogenase